MSGTLFVVATPIGNLEDITLRALRVLREADLIAAEDTRRTAKLLTSHGIATPTLSFHEHNVRTRLPQLIARLDAGAQVAVVTDAGTPGISDPGARLVQVCREHGIPVTVVPGPSAPLAAAVASGFPLVPLTIYGFAPARSSDRIKWLSGLTSVSHTVTFFEAPHRIRQTLLDAGSTLGERPMALARELTKLHEEVLSGTAGSLAEQLETSRGEFTVVVGPAEAHHLMARDRASDAELVHEFGRITDIGTATRREAVTAVAKKYGLPAREVYAAIERAKS